MTFLVNFVLYLFPILPGTFFRSVSVVSGSVVQRTSISSLVYGKRLLETCNFILMLIVSIIARKFDKSKSQVLRD
jgi:hypothetical protein